MNHAEFRGQEETVPKATVTQITREIVPLLPLITVVLIQESRIVRDGIKSLLSRFADMRVIAVTPRESETLREGAKPVVALLDLRLKSADRLNVAKGIISSLSEIPIIVMNPPGAEESMKLIRAGVSGFIATDATVEATADTIRTVAAGNPSLPAEMTNGLFSEIAKAKEIRGEGDGNTSPLTARENEIVHLIGEGMSNKAIAARLHISIHTVKSHLRNVMEKLSLHSRLQIATNAHANSLESSENHRNESEPEKEK